MTRVMLAIDGSDLDEALVASAQNLFGDDAEYWAINVQPTSQQGGALAVPAAPLPAYGVPYPVNMPDAHEPATGGTAAEADAEARLRATSEADSVIDENQVPFAHAVGVADDDPADVIVREAQARDVDVVVVGSHGRSWLSRLVRPSVSKQVLERGLTPVLVVGTDADLTPGDD